LAGQPEGHLVERRMMAGNCCIPAGFGKMKFQRIGDLPKAIVRLFRPNRE
jgi:hypothetical protein